MKKQNRIVMSLRFRLVLLVAAVTYYGNEPLMRQVWSNLLSNAVKFSPRGDLCRSVCGKKTRGSSFGCAITGPAFRKAL